MTLLLVHHTHFRHYCSSLAVGYCGYTPTTTANVTPPHTHFRHCCSFLATTITVNTTTDCSHTNFRHSCWPSTLIFDIILLPLQLASAAHFAPSSPMLRFVPRTHFRQVRSPLRISCRSPLRIAFEDFEAVKAPSKRLSKLLRSLLRNDA